MLYYAQVPFLKSWRKGVQSISSLVIGNPTVIIVSWCCLHILKLIAYFTRIFTFTYYYPCVYITWPLPPYYGPIHRLVSDSVTNAVMGKYGRSTHNYWLHYHSSKQEETWASNTILLGVELIFPFFSYKTLTQCFPCWKSWPQHHPHCHNYWHASLLLCTSKYIKMREGSLSVNISIVIISH